MSGDNFFNVLSSKSSKKSFKNIHQYNLHVGKKIGQEQSFYTFDLADILWKAQLWRENLPTVDPFYAVKANADPVVIRLFVLLGYGFDCSTEGEIKLALKAGADPKRVIFAHTVKTRGALKYAYTAGVDLMTFDSEEELLKIHEVYPTARLVLRLKSGSSQTYYNLSRKFGASLSQAESLLVKAKELNLNVIGVSFHVGALCEDPSTFTSSIDNSRLIFDLAKRLGYNFTIMNIGAGFFGSKEREEYFYELTRMIMSSLKENFQDKNTIFMAEPGCFCVCSAVTLTTAIIGKKTKRNKDAEIDGIQKEYFINDGFYSSFFEHFDIYDVKHKPLLSASDVVRRQIHRSKIWGLTCCSEDVILEECSIPEMEEGEFLVWENMGAYSRGVCSTFTCVPYPDSRYVFIRNPKIQLDWIPNVEEISKVIADVATFVENDTDLEEVNESLCIRGLE